MEFEMIGSQSMAAIVMMIVFGIVVPLGLAIAWKIIKKEKFTTTLIGAAMFMAFAIVLEAIPKLVLFSNSNPIGKYVMSHNAAMILTGALLAGVFEETGRFFAFKVLLKNRKNKETAISYGIGHGGIEIAYIFVASGVNYITYALLINAGGFGEVVEQVRLLQPDQANQLVELARELATLRPVDTLAGFFERISAMIFHIACSIIVFKGVREKGKIWYYPVAIALHTAFDCIAGMYQTGIISNVYVLEGIIFVAAVVIFVFSIYLYKGMPAVYDAEEDEAQAKELDDIRKMGL